jgi:hypothetical protein
MTAKVGVDRACQHLKENAMGIKVDAKTASKRYRGKRSVETAMFERSLRRAREKEVPHTIQPSDIKIPKECPINGLKLVRGKGVAHSGSPTLVCVDQRLGYVPGNIVVVSFRASYNHYRITKWWHLKDATI